jgi:hypothetical protein
MMHRRDIVWHMELKALLLTGLSGKDIAFRMGITLGTYKAYAHRLYEKLGVSNRTELMAAEIDRLAGILAAEKEEVLKPFALALSSEAEAFCL